MVAAAGEVLLRNGADVSRVEDTLARIARAFGMEEAEIYATPTGLFISLGGDSHVTVIRRVPTRTLALDRISAINNLSRDLTKHPMPPEEALRRIRWIGEQRPPLPGWFDVPASAIAAAACTMLVGGTLSDFWPAVVANLAVTGAQRIATRLRLPDTLGDFSAGATAVFSALAASRWLGAQMGPVVAGGVMILVPGIAFTNAVRDAIAGDLVSSGARTLEAVLKAAALAAGVAAALYFTGAGRVLP